MSEQAEQALESSGTVNDLASYLADTPEGESEQEEDTLADESTGDEPDTEEEASDGQDDPDAEPEEGEEVEEEEPAPVDQKITVKVKGEDGKEETLELTPDEIASSYMRQRDYTRKTQELAQRENEAVQLLTQKHEEIRNQYLSQAELQRAAFVQMVGLRSESEMAELAQSDPAAWVAENQRQRQIGAYLSQLDQRIQSEKQQAEAQRTQAQQQMLAKQYEVAWNELSKEGIDKPKLAKVYEGAVKQYGLTPQELANVYDPRLVKMMRDAVAYRALKEQKPQVQKQVKEAPRLPSKQNAPAQTRIDKALENKFRTGRAKLNDLAALLR